MSDIAIRVDNLSKLYRIGGPQERYKTLRDTVMDVAAAPIQRLRRLGQPTPPEEIIWALKDVSFEVKHGEVLGIIGRNGSGKTTLLKVLSRITEPTEGQAEIHGRVGSLLEVGTGFHPELTGRENVYLNGAILGMKRAEIDRTFDEIVEFAEIEKFLDTPVKRYSSGMYVRLAFAVAAHLEPEILLVDEVLAVGDVAFQKKCLGQMGDVARGGRTVLFVSHNMAAVHALCSRAVSLEDGAISAAGETSEVIATYLSSFQGEALPSLGERFGKGEPEMLAWFTDIRFQSPDGAPITAATSGQAADIVLSYRAKREDLQLDFGIGVYTMMGDRVLYFSTMYSDSHTRVFPRCGDVICRIPKLPLSDGRYSVNLSLRHKKEALDLVPGAAVLDVQAGDFYGTGRIPPSSENKVLMEHSWIF